MRDNQVSHSTEDGPSSNHHKQFVRAFIEFLIKRAVYFHVIFWLIVCLLVLYFASFFLQQDCLSTLKMVMLRGKLELVGGIAIAYFLGESIVDNIPIICYTEAERSYNADNT